MDVGANIGIVSLAVLSRVPDARVFAFEPGPHQHDLFAETIARNDLHRCDLALPDGAVRPPRDEPLRRARAAARRRGRFRDTGRSGPARFVTVDTDTLDRWWERLGRPPLDVIKLDTEGSELLVLRGAVEIVRRHRPALFLEIDERNLRPYAYGTDDVRAFLEELGYELEALGRSDFVARPR